MKFIKTESKTGKVFISIDGEFKAVNYGGKVFLFKKFDYFHYGSQKKYRAFGNSAKYDKFGNSKTYKTYREAFKDAGNK